MEERKKWLTLCLHLKLTSMYTCKLDYNVSFDLGNVKATKIIKLMLVNLIHDVLWHDILAQNDHIN